MKLSWFGITTVGLVLATVILRFMDIGNVSNWAIRIGPIIVMILLLVIAAVVLSATRRRGTKEKYVWSTFLVASIMNLIGGIFEVLPAIMGTKNETFVMISSAFFLLAYIGFIIGLALANYQFRGMKKINPWIPIVVTLVAFGIGLFFLFRFMSASNIDIILQITFSVFMLFDAVLVLLAWMLANRTWGGSLSTSYVTIAFGCIGLAVFHIMAVVSVIGGNFTVDSMIRTVFVIMLGMIAIGGDIRLSIENKLRI